MLEDYLDKDITEQDVLRYLEEHLVEIDTDKGRPSFVFDSMNVYRLEYLRIDKGFKKTEPEEVPVTRRTTMEMLEELKLKLVEKLDEKYPLGEVYLELGVMRNDSLTSCRYRFLELEKYIKEHLPYVVERAWDSHYVPANNLNSKHDIKIAVAQAMLHLEKA